MKKFLDTVVVKFKAGNGGNGATVFFQDWMQKKAHPQGGDGGCGSDIILIANKNLNTLNLVFIEKKIIDSPHGQNGSKSNRHGKNGDDLYFEVPVGTLVFNEKQTELIFNFAADGQKFIVAEGGRGGWGNQTLSRKHRKSINYSYPGTLGQERIVLLDLRMFAQIAFIGLPNVGKTSLLNSVSDAKGRVGNYTFTTLSPNLGHIYSLKPKRRILIADLPGIIEKAHLNKGLGNKFLKHIQRCFLLLHVIDLSQLKKNIINNFRLINNELFNYSKYFAQIPQIIVANKLDVSLNDSNLDLNDFKFLDFKFLDFIKVSSLKTMNLLNLKTMIFQTFDKKRNKQTVIEKIIQNTTKNMITYRYEAEKLIHLRKISDNTWELSSTLIDDFVRNLNLENEADLVKLNNYLDESKISQRLNSEGVRKKDLIYLKDKQFYWKN